MTYCKYCQKAIGDVVDPVCKACRAKRMVTKGWHFTYRFDKRPAERIRIGKVGAKAMMFLYGLNCVALFVGYCVLFFLAVMLVALIISLAAKKGGKSEK